MKIRVTEPHSNQPLAISELIDHLTVIQRLHGDLLCAIYSARKRSSVPLIAACVSAWPMLDERKTRVMFSEQTETVVDEMVFDLMEEAAELRQQLAEAQERQVVAMRERDSLRGMLTGCREAIGATDNTQLLEMCEAAAALREQLAAERGRLEYEAGAAQAALLMQLADVQSRLIEAQTALAAVPVDAIRRYWHMSNPVESWDDAAEECVEVYRAMHQFLDEPDGAGCYADDWTPAHRPGKGDAR